MNRAYLIAYLTTQDCNPDDNNMDYQGASQIWRNSINGLETLIPYDDELSLGIFCKIFYELKVDPPKEHGYDSDYAVFISFMHI